MTVSWSWAVIVDLGAGFTDISPDVLRERGLHAASGLTGSAITDRVAPPGSLSFTLNNGESNSAGKLGYYSADHANLRSGFGQGNLVQFNISSGADTTNGFTGFISEDPSSPNQFGDRETQVTVIDFMEQFAIRKLNRVPVQTGIRTDQLLTLIMATMPLRTSVTQSYDVSPDTFDYALQDEQDEKTFIITVLQKACQSDLGYIYIKGTVGSPTLRYESRNTRILNMTSLFTLDNTMTDLVIERKEDNIINDVHVPVLPAVVDTAATTVLATNPSEILLNPGEERTISLRYVDPLGAGRRISGKDLVDPLVADTDYKFSSKAGDGGNDLNAVLTITYAAKGGNTADVTVTNTGAKSGYLNLLQVRGRGIYLYDAQEAIAGDATSQSKYGDRILTYQIPYQQSFNIAQDFANEINRRYHNPFTRVQSVMFYADADSSLMHAALTLDIGDRITLKEAATGINADFYINGREFIVTPQNHLQVKWVLEAALNMRVCILDDPNSAVLDVNAYLAF